MWVLYVLLYSQNNLFVSLSFVCYWGFWHDCRWSQIWQMKYPLLHSRMGGGLLFYWAVGSIVYYISWKKFKVYTTLFAIVQWKTLSRISCLLFLWSEINMYSSKTMWFSAILWETLTAYLNKCKHWVLQLIKYLGFFLVDHLKLYIPKIWKNYVCNFFFFVGFYFQTPLTLLEITSRKLESLLEGQDPDTNSGRWCGMHFYITHFTKINLSSVGYNSA